MALSQRVKHFDFFTLPVRGYLLWNLDFFIRLAVINPDSVAAVGQQLVDRCIDAVHRTFERFVGAVDRGENGVAVLCFL